MFNILEKKGKNILENAPGLCIAKSVAYSLLVHSLALPIFFQRNDDSHCDRIHSSLSAGHCLNHYSVAVAMATCDLLAEALSCLNRTPQIRPHGVPLFFFLLYRIGPLPFSMACSKRRLKSEINGCFPPNS